MSQWAELRHQHFVAGVPKKALARRFGLDVKTVRRALELEEPPRRAAVARPRVLDPHREEIEALLQADPKITAKRIGRVLEAKTGQIRPRTLRKYVASLRGELFKKEAFVHRTHRPGHTTEGDFGESWAVIAGDLRKVKFFVSTLPASNAYFAKAYPVERLECLLDGIAESFAFFGGVAERYVLDNASMVVKKVLRGRDREVTQAFEGFRGQYPFGVDFCTPAKGNEKGSVETGVKYVRNNCFRPMPNVASFDELNDLILRELQHDMDVRTLPDGRTVRQAWQAEREHLRPLPAHRPEACRQMSRVADKFGHVKVARATYSVPIRFAYRPVWVKAYFDRMEISVNEKLVACHERVFAEGAFQLDPKHVLRLLEKKHRAVAESTAMQAWDVPEVFERLREQLRKDTRKPDQEWVRVLLLAEEHGEEVLEAAVGEALDRGSGRLETIRQILRRKEREIEVRPTEAIPTDPALLEITIEAPRLAAYDDLGEETYDESEDRGTAASSGGLEDAVPIGGGEELGAHGRGGQEAATGPRGVPGGPDEPGGSTSPGAAHPAPDEGREVSVAQDARGLRLQGAAQA
jgi:transposase